jgi:hypothetical protein
VLDGLWSMVSASLGLVSVGAVGLSGVLWLLVGLLCVVGAGCWWSVHDGYWWSVLRLLADVGSLSLRSYCGSNVGGSGG